MEAEMHQVPELHPGQCLVLSAWHLFRESHHIQVFYRNQTVASANRVSTEVAANFISYLLNEFGSGSAYILLATQN